MGLSDAVVRFPCGTLRYATYQNTSDCLYDYLHPEWFRHWDVTKVDAECRCGGDVPVEIATDYGNGFSWAGRACLACAAVTQGHEPYEGGTYHSMRNGLPAWWPLP